ncbi:RHS repeat domain-containing protein, partial [Pectobacterium versatile]|uniref:RHS repeat domain-containing protein n=1 Tax=Pectobacterium versatile TaxID=2488639 RepID=UPI0020BF1F27
DALGQRYQFRYGAFDNLLEATDPLGATVDWTYGFDPSGRLTKAASPDAVVEYAYNRAGQVTSETVNGEAVQSGYDAGGQRAVVEGILAPL